MPVEPAPPRAPAPLPVEPASPRARAPVPAARGHRRHRRGAPPWILRYHSVTEATARAAGLGAGLVGPTFDETTTPPAVTAPAPFGGIR